MTIFLLCHRRQEPQVYCNDVETRRKSHAFDPSAVEITRIIEYLVRK